MTEYKQIKELLSDKRKFENDIEELREQEQKLEEVVEAKKHRIFSVLDVLKQKGWKEIRAIAYVNPCRADHDDTYWEQKRLGDSYDFHSNFRDKPLFHIFASPDIPPPRLEVSFHRKDLIEDFGGKTNENLEKIKQWFAALKVGEDYISYEQDFDGWDDYD